MTSILNTPIRMKDESGPGSLTVVSIFQSRYGRIISFQTLAHGPADNLTVKDIQDDREIKPALSGTNISNIRGPELIGASGGKILIDQIGRYRIMMFGIRADFIFSLCPGTNVVLPHQTGDPGTTTPIALITKGISDPGTPIGLMAGLMNNLNLFYQHLILLFSLSGCSVNPLVITTQTNF